MGQLVAAGRTGMNGNSHPYIQGHHPSKDFVFKTHVLNYCISYIMLTAELILYCIFLLYRSKIKHLKSSEFATTVYCWLGCKH
jgi:hypothetical protein